MGILKKSMSRIEIIVIVVTITIFVGVLSPVFIKTRMARADMFFNLINQSKLKYSNLDTDYNNPYGETTAVLAEKSYTVIGGDPITSPILLSACEVVKKIRKGFTYSDDGYNGSLNNEKRPDDYLEGSVVSGAVPEKLHNQVSKVEIGVDAMVVIVSKKCAIKVGTIDLSSRSFVSPNNKNKRRMISINDLQTIIQSDGYGVLNNKATDTLPENSIANNHDWNLYLQSKDDASRKTIAANLATKSTPGGFGAYFKDGGYTGQNNYKARCGDGKNENDADTFRGIYCSTDLEIVDKIANDELGIGIVSAAYEGWQKVDIVAINFGIPTENAIYPYRNPYNYGTSETCTWPFRRNLYAYYTKGKASEDVAELVFIKYKDSFKQSPLYKASYWPPENW